MTFKLLELEPKKNKMIEDEPKFTHPVIKIVHAKKPKTDIQGFDWLTFGFPIEVSGNHAHPSRNQQNCDLDSEVQSKFKVNYVTRCKLCSI